MDPPKDLQDSGLQLCALLARLLNLGVLLLDEAHRCCFASARACDLLGAPDEAALRNDWHVLRAQFDLSNLPVTRGVAPPIQRGVDLSTPAGMRRLRFEVHSVVASPRTFHVVLLRDRNRIDDADRLLLMASEAQASRAALAGLVHEAKGPLNNFHLTLALLAAGLARIETLPGADAATARWRRYLDVLQAEAAQLVDCIHEIDALPRRGLAGRERVDLRGIVRDVVRLLRHEATMREARIELDDLPEPAWVVGDAHGLRLALLGFTTCAIDVAERGVVRVRVATAGAEISVRIGVTTASLPPALTTELFAVACTSVSVYPAIVAGRMIIEAHGGDVAIECELPGAREFHIRMPAV